VSPREPATASDAIADRAGAELSAPNEPTSAPDSAPLPSPEPAPPPAGGDVTVAPSADEAPITLTAFPETATGALADGAAWLPPIAEPEPSVAWPVPWVPAGAALRDRGLDESPSTDTEFPPTATGAVAAGDV